MNYPAMFQTQAEALIAAAAGNLDAPVPSCPGWDNRRLVSHVARLLASTAAHLPRGVVDPPAFTERPPAQDEALVAHYRASLAATLAAFQAVDPAAPAWNFTNAPQVAGFWPRRLTHELQIHAWDAASAVGPAPELDPALAADGIDEVLRVLLPAARAAGLTSHAEGTAHVHLTDPLFTGPPSVMDEAAAPPAPNGEWMVALAGDSVEVSEGHEKGDAGLRGPAGPALLAIWGRTGFDGPGLSAFGDQDLLTALRPGR
ncbi:maleylpyruvate isomerase family mycothiol-dependent enzyme [Pseudofrankia sp. DC12]|uniref:maleylpyruvate isomerase family mycothiol-dependent enzyme n=1 Tax=Pseudofrankia sp. DC12 TaxID=683315 RepID=UPI0005F7DCDB|nr:maleylpyruvate isomerase family mycothiol-dependent enzyme [Pseudofrankia sp. DC12]